MGIFGALTTAVTGMRAQSYALENISGNIANSQTTAFKGVTTSFQDLIPDAAATQQLAGSVTAYSSATNNVQGDIQAASIGTFMAINGQGYFVVAQPSSTVDGHPIFDGVDLYTRRGDFQLDQNGYLVNGAGNYLMGIAIDPATGNLTGSVPTILQFNNNMLPAQATTQIEYRVNLASTPRTTDYDSNVPGSELLNIANFSASPVAGAPSVAKLLGTGASLVPDGVAKMSGTLDISALSSAGGDLVLTGSGTATITVDPGDDAAAIVAKINSETATTGITATIDQSGHLILTSGDAKTPVTIGGSSSLAILDELGLSVGTANPNNLLTQGAVAAGQTLVITIGSNPPQTLTFGTGPGEIATLADLSTALGALPGGFGSVNTQNGNLTITAANMADTITVGGTASALAFGLHVTTALPSNGTVIANDVSTFLEESISGGSITVYDQSGAPMNIQLRWAKVDSAATGGTDTWNLFYQVDSNASGTAVAWQNVGTNFSFAPNGQMNPPVTNLTLNNVSVNGVSLGSNQLSFGSGGITQFADPNGNAQVNLLQQNGYAAGQLVSVSIDDNGRIVGSYSNGRMIALAEITLANFNNPNGLQRLDGGTFAATSASGSPTYGAAGNIIGSALEGSNVDIADEFTKLIVTQQAYSANTRVITTANQMVQELINMIR